MKITSVSASYARTQNTGNFSNLKTEVTYHAEVTVEDGEDPEQVARELRELAKKAVQEQLWLDRSTYAGDWPAAPTDTRRGGPYSS